MYSISGHRVGEETYGEMTVHLYELSKFILNNKRGNPCLAFIY